MVQPHTGGPGPTAKVGGDGLWSKCSRPGAGQRQWEGQKDSPCSLHRHSPAAQPCGSQPCARTLCSTAPRPHQHFLAAATPGSPVPPFLVLTVFSASSTMPYQHPAPCSGWPSRPPWCGAIPASLVQPVHPQHQLVQQRVTSGCGGHGEARAEDTCVGGWNRRPGDTDPEQGSGADYKNARVHTLTSL